MSRIEAGSLQPERQAVAIDELLDNRVRRLARLLRDTTVTVDAAPGLPLVSADYTMVEQVVTNLLENATRHSPPGSQITVGARAHGGFIEISVTDEGPGSTPPTSTDCSVPSSGARKADRAGLAWRSVEPSSRPTAGRSGRASGNGHQQGARFTFTLPVHRG